MAQSILELTSRLRSALCVLLVVSYSSLCFLLASSAMIAVDIDSSSSPEYPPPEHSPQDSEQAPHDQLVQPPSTGTVHDWVLQDVKEFELPRQSAPPFAGTGFVQVLDPDFEPPPHVTEQLPQLQSVQPPSTEAEHD